MLPLGHAEELALLERCVLLCEALVDEAPAPLRKLYAFSAVAGARPPRRRRPLRPPAPPQRGRSAGPRPRKSSPTSPPATSSTAARSRADPPATITVDPDAASQLPCVSTVSARFQQVAQGDGEDPAAVSLAEGHHAPVGGARHALPELRHDAEQLGDRREAGLAMVQDPAVAGALGARSLLRRHDRRAGERLVQPAVVTLLDQMAEIERREIGRSVVEHDRREIALVILAAAHAQGAEGRGARHLGPDRHPARSPEQGPQPVVPEDLGPDCGDVLPQPPRHQPAEPGEAFGAVEPVGIGGERRVAVVVPGRDRADGRIELEQRARAPGSSRRSRARSRGRPRAR